jgi:hypothetical protein
MRFSDDQESRIGPLVQRGIEYAKQTGLPSQSANDVLALLPTIQSGPMQS